MSFIQEMTSAYNDMLDIKTSLGFCRHNYVFHISPFIDFCADRYPDANKITDEGRDVVTLMPYLSTYMGHVSLEETLYYVHLLPDRIKSSPGIDWDMLCDIYCTEEDFYAED